MSPAAAIAVEAIPDEALTPHEGPQSDFCASPADICIGGGQRGGGKTRALLYEATRHVHRAGFNAVLFRRTAPRLTAVGGPWPESFAVFPNTPTPGVPGRMEWRWPTADGNHRGGGLVQFRHLQHEKDKLAWKGAQIALLLFDQLEEFSGGQFWDLIACLRSVSGVAPYVRATCNPVPEDDPTGGWLAKLLAWWINQDTGYAIPERAGKVRWLVRDDLDVLQWFDSKADALAAFPQVRDLLDRSNRVYAHAAEALAAGIPTARQVLVRQPLSLSFVPMALEDNPTLRQADPGYEAKLDALPYVERMRYRRGNWKVRAGKGTIFKATNFKFIRPEDLPQTWRPTCRFWDLAATDPRDVVKGHDPDYTAGGRLSLELRADALPERIFVEDIRHAQVTDAEPMILAAARDDGPHVSIREEQEPGSSGKTVVRLRRDALAGFDYMGRPSSGSKYTNWKPFAAQVEQGNVYLVGDERTPWIVKFLSEAENVPEGHDDQVDAVTRAYLELKHHGAGGQGGVVPLAGFRR